jgi:D-amino-acid dehydrogenase
VQNQHVAIIGAGAVGVCCANYLLDAGYSVELIDPVESGSPDQCSYGNAGGLSPGSCIPNAMPGILRQVPGMLLDPEGPIGLRLVDLPHALPWLTRFLWSSRQSRVNEISDAMRALNQYTFTCYEPLLKQAGLEDLIRIRGQLFAYEDPQGPAKSTLSVGMRRQRGVKVEILDEAQLRELEPALGPAYKAGVYLPEQGQCANPGRLVAGLARLASDKGARFTRTKARALAMDGRKVTGVITESGLIKADHVVIAAGAFSGPFARQLGQRIPLISERGYHVMIEGDGTGLKVQTGSAERKFVAAPMEEGLRLSGTVEFAPEGTGPFWRRTEILLKQARHMFPQLDATRVKHWMGNRPGTPDSIPVIEKAPDHANVVYAFGHGHQGLIGASVTGKIVSQLVANVAPLIDLAPYRSSRF